MESRGVLQMLYYLEELGKITVCVRDERLVGFTTFFNYSVAAYSVKQ